MIGALLGGLGLTLLALGRALWLYRVWRGRAVRNRQQFDTRHAAFLNDLRVLLNRQRTVSSVLYEMLDHYQIPETDEMPKLAFRLLGENQAIVKDLYDR